MASVSATLKMFDMMTRPLQQVTQALNMTIGAMDDLSNSANTDLNITRNLDSARTAIRNAEAGFRTMSEEVDSATNSQNNFNNSVNNGGNMISSMTSRVKGLVGAYIGIQTIKKAMQATDNYTNQRARLALINDGLQTQAQLEEKVYNAAQRSRTAYGDTAATIAKLGLLAKGTFGNNDEVIAFGELMNKSFKVSGASAEEVKSGMYQLTQAMASGRLQGDEFRSIIENAPMLAQTIAEYTGVGMEGLKQMSSDGAIGADIIKGALFSAADEIEEKYKTMPRTFSDVWVDISNQAGHAFKGVMQSVNNLLNSDYGQGVINRISISIQVIAALISWVVDKAVMFSDVISNNWGIIEPIMWGIVVALAAYNAAIIIYNTQKAISNGLTAWAVFQESAHAASLMMSAGATFSATVAQHGLNAALYACPLTWIILAIIAVIAVFYIAIAVVNHFAGTSISATGIIMGVFYVLGAVIFNIIASLWNTFSIFVEFIANVFNHPVYSIMMLFANMAINLVDNLISISDGADGVATAIANAFIWGANKAIGAINWITDALNNIPGIDIGKVGEIGSVGSFTSSLKGMKGKIQSTMKAAMPDDYVVTQKLDKKSLGGTFNNGYNFGSGLGDKFNLSNLLGGVPSGSDLGDFGKNAGAYPGEGDVKDIGKGVGDNNKALKGINDKLEVSNEQLQMMRDIAEREAVKNFVTLSPTVKVTHTGNINNGYDLETIVGRIEEKIDIEIAAGAKEVYDLV